MTDTKPPYETDDITLRDLILKVREGIHEVLRFWYIPALVALIGAGFQAYKYFTYEPVYPATITFSVDEDEGGGASGLAGILGQFGFGSVRPSRYNLDKILALSKSRRVIEETLFSKITIDGNEDFLANHLMEEYALDGMESASGSDDRFRFKHDSLAIFGRQENEMLKNLYGFIIGPPEDPKKALVNADYNDDSNIMSINVATTNETLSLELANRLFESLSDYYINKAIEKQLITYELVTQKRDSVLGELRSAEYQLAAFKDANRGLMLRTDQLNELRLQREIVGLTAMYAEVVKNAEVADFSLKNKTPFIQVIDAPLSPIAPALLSLPRKLAIGLIVGGLLGALFVWGRMLYRQTMAPVG